MGQRARELMNAEIKRIGYQLNALEIASNSTQDYTRRGLSPTSSRVCRIRLTTCGKLNRPRAMPGARAHELGFDADAVGSRSSPMPVIWPIVPRLY